MIIDFKKEFDSTSAVIESKLRDYKNYHTWWPKKFRVAHTNHKGYDQLYFSPLFGLTIIWEFEWKENVLHTFYKNGPVTGSGQWIIETDNNKTTLHYNIDVKPKNLFWKMLLIPSVFKKTHIKHMESIFEELEQFSKIN